MLEVEDAVHGLRSASRTCGTEENRSGEEGGSGPSCNRETVVASGRISNPEVYLPTRLRPVTDLHRFCSALSLGVLCLSLLFQAPRYVTHIFDGSRHNRSIRVGLSPPVTLWSSPKLTYADAPISNYHQL